MQQQTLQQRLDDTRATDDPFGSLYAIAESLRDTGLSQIEIYRIYSELYLRHQADQDDAFYCTIADVLDCIWSGGWGDRSDLFDTSLTDDQTRIVSIDVEGPTDDSDVWEMTFDHPSFYLRFRISGPQIVHDLLVFIRTNMNSRPHNELKLGTLGVAEVSIIKDDEFPNRFFVCVLASDGAVRYTLNSNELVDYIRGLTRAADELPSLT